jgi:hypothetical protein
MPITQSKTDSTFIDQFASGSYADDAASPAAMSITTGFTPRYIRVINQTTNLQYEWYEGMTAGHMIQTATAGTRTAPTSNGFTVTSHGFTLATAPAQNNQLRWQAFA